MRNRRQRSFLILFIFYIVGLLLITLLLDLTGWQPWLKLTLLISVILVLLRFSATLFQKLNSSRLVDLPSWLIEKYPPVGLQKNLDVKLDIVLLRPPSVIGSAPDCGEALGLGYLASVLREKGFHVLILDARLMALDAMQTVELLMTYQAPILGINLNFETLYEVTDEIIRGIRKRNFAGHITLGGLYASVAAEFLMEHMPEVNTIVRYEGEDTYLELVTKIIQPDTWAAIPGLVYRGEDGNTVLNPLRPLIADLDVLPQPARDLLPLVVKQEGFAYVLSSRGCNGVCAYCIQQRTVSDPKGNRWRGRAVQDVVDEIAVCVQQFGIKNISFVDDDLFGGAGSGATTHAHRLGKALTDRDLDINLLISVQPYDVEYETFELLKRAGLASVILAVDNFSQPMLDRYRKMVSVDQNLRSIEILTSLDIDAYLGIIMFDPWTTLDELEDNFEIISTKPIPYLRPWQIVERLEAYYGGVLTDLMVQQGIINPNGKGREYEFLDLRTKSVFLALKKMIETVQPALSLLDQYRWGSVGLSQVDEDVKRYCKDNLGEMFVVSNYKIGGLALEILRQQKESEVPLKISDLVRSSILEELQQFNSQTMQAVQELKVEALSAVDEGDLPK